MRNDIEASFGGNFLPLFRNETDFIRYDAQRNVNDLLGIAHFQIQFGHDVLAQSLDISILNVAAIGPQMGNDPASSSAFAHSRGNKWIRLCILGFRHRGISRLPQRCYVIDVDSQAQTAHWPRELIAANRTQSTNLSKSETNKVAVFFAKSA
jgi:hypothetical protein